MMLLAEPSFKYLRGKPMSTQNTIHSSSCSFTQLWLLRGADLLLALAVLAVLFPLWLSALPGSRLLRIPVHGRHGRLYDQFALALPAGRRGQILQALGVAHLPVVVNILLGDIAWVGPRALPAAEADAELAEADAELAEARQAVRPGLFSLWRLRQLTMIDFGSEWESDIEQIRHQSFLYDYGMLLRNLLASLYGGRSEQPATSSVLVDTLRVSPASVADTLDRIASCVRDAGAGFMQLCFINPHCVNVARKNARYRRVVNEAGLAVPDGIGMRIAGRLLGKPFRHNLNGTDLFPRLCERLATLHGKLFLLGGQPGIADQTAAWISRHYPAVQVVGSCHGYFDAASEADVIATIRASGADVLLVAMGVPQQDLWIAQHGPQTGVKVAMGVGGLFDFCSGRIARAPQWLRELGLEWTFRLYSEPARMWRRYLVGNLSFMIAVCMQRWLGSLDCLGLPGDAALPIPPGAPTRAMVVIGSAEGSDLPTQTDLSPVMMPLGDRPLLFRTMETLAGLGCREVHLFASQDVVRIRAFVGTGERWGLQATVHGVRSPADAWARIARFRHADDERIWLHQAERWLPANALGANNEDAVWLHADAAGSLQWSGWARISQQHTAAVLQALVAGRMDSAVLPPTITAYGSQPAYCYDTAEGMLEAQARWLARQRGQFELLADFGPGIRVAASAHIEPGATLLAPVEISENARVRSGARVGPNVVLGTDVQVAGDVVLSESLVTDGVSVGGPAAIVSSIVTQAGIYSCAHAVWLPAATTGYLLGASAEHAPAQVTLTERMVALLLLVIAGLPVLLLKLSGRAGDFCHDVYPRLPAVLQGKRSLIGVGDPATIPDSIRSAGWGHLLSQSPRGLITPRKALGLTDADAAAWADVHWILHNNLQQRWRLLRSYLQAGARA